jgi:hypothetical protein
MQRGPFPLQEEFLPRLLDEYSKCLWMTWQNGLTKPQYHVDTDLEGLGNLFAMTSCNFVSAKYYVPQNNLYWKH